MGERFYEEFKATSKRLLGILKNMRAGPHLVDADYEGGGWIYHTAWLGTGKYYRGSRSIATVKSFGKNNDWDVPDPLRGALRAAALALFRNGEKSEEAFPIRKWRIDFVNTAGKEEHLSVLGPGISNPPVGARAVASRLWHRGEPALARALIKAAGSTFMVEIKSKPPRFIYDPDGERVTDDEMINLLSSYFREEGKHLKNRLKVREVSTRGRWFTVYIDSPSDTESAMGDAEDEVMRIIREAADLHPELRQWSDDIRDKDLELGVL